jgi:hypothetical protein
MDEAIHRRHTSNQEGHYEEIPEGCSIDLDSSIDLDITKRYPIASWREDYSIMG